MKIRRVVAAFMTVVLTMVQMYVPAMAGEESETVAIAEESDEETVSEDKAWDGETDAWLSGYEYTVKDGKLHLTAGKDTLAGDIVIAAKAKVNGTEYPVVIGARSATDGSSFFGYMNNKITGIKVEKGTELADDARYIFSTLTELVSLDVSGLDTSKTTNMHGLFYYDPKLTGLDVSNFDTSNVTDMSWMFKGSNKLKLLDLKSFNTSKVESMGWMFDGCAELESLDVSSFDTSNVTDMESVFFNCKSLEALDVSAFKTSKVTKADQLFSDCEKLKSLDVSGFDTSNITSMQNMFNNCKSLTELDVRKFNTSKVEKMGGMFSGCVSLNSVDVSGFDTANVTNMACMFANCHELKTLDVSKFKTSNVTDFASMFNECRSLTSVDVSNFNTSNVTDMGYMFAGCSKLVSLDVSNFNTSKVVRIYDMFLRCSSLKSIDVSHFDTSNVTDMGYMFAGCSSLTDLDIRNFKISKDCGVNNLASNSAVNLYIPIRGLVTGSITNNSQLKKIYYPGTEAQFKALGIQVPDGVEVIYNYTEGMTIRSANPLSPIPFITDTTTELYLVKGQKFDLPAGEWESEKNKVLNISKKGIVKAKKVTSEPILMKKKDGSQNIKVYISAPKIGKAVRAGSEFLDGYECAKFNVPLEYDKEHLSVYWYCSSPDVATVSAGGNVLFLKPGKVTVTAYINGKAYSKKVSYSNKYVRPSYATMHINLGETKKISMKGVKNAVWEKDNDNVAIDGNRLTAKTAGETKLTAVVGGGDTPQYTYTMKVFVEDISVSGEGITSAGTNKYAVNVKAGDTVNIAFKAVSQPVLLKSSNTKVATVDEDCNITVRAKGKAVISTKLNGKTVKININSAQ
ncbi:MAG: BspA family leucine-rich repeat surface protein [Lachnospiraceae bacterium]|nr:BspA family leucine-rich repeat surface protein [Lachnospiraceae bacterium]